MNPKVIILAKKLKHAVSVLRTTGVNDVVLHIFDEGIECRAGNAANSLLCGIKIDPTACSEYTPDDLVFVGIDLERLVSVLNRTRAQDNVRLEMDENDMWLTWDIHQRRIPLFDPTKIKKPVGAPELQLTASFEVSGRQFIDIVSNASDVGEALQITTDERNTMIDTVSKHRHPEAYCATVTASSGEQVPAVAMYDIATLGAIAHRMVASDVVTMSYATDLPCMIEYERGGVRSMIMLAPRVESD